MPTIMWWLIGGGVALWALAGARSPVIPSTRRKVFLAVGDLLHTDKLSAAVATPVSWAWSLTEMPPNLKVLKVEDLTAGKMGGTTFRWTFVAIAPGSGKVVLHRAPGLIPSWFTAEQRAATEANQEKIIYDVVVS